jgi:hypothetical protein
MQKTRALAQYCNPYATCWVSALIGIKKSLLALEHELTVCRVARCRNGSDTGKSSKIAGFILRVASVQRCELHQVRQIVLQFVRNDVRDVEANVFRIVDDEGLYPMTVRTRGTDEDTL